MVAKINRLLVAVLLVAATTYILLQNWSNTTLTLSPSYQFSAPTGVIVIATFILGILATTLVAACFGAVQFMREKRLKSKLEQANRSCELILDARTERTIGNPKQAQRVLEKAVKKEPKNALARLELAELQIELGEDDQAMRTLSTNIMGPESSPSLLLAAAHLLELHGNRSAAYDYLAYAKQSLSSADITATLARLALHLGKNEAAKRNIDELMKLNADEQIIARLKAQELLLSEVPTSEKITAAKKLNRSFPRSPDVRRLLAELYLEMNDVDSAASELKEKAKITALATDWRQLTHLWLDNNFAQKAIDAATTASKQTKGIEKCELLLTLASLQLSSGLETKADETLSLFADEAKATGLDGEAVAERLLLLRSYYWALKSTLSALRAQPGAAQHALLNLERSVPPSAGAETKVETKVALSAAKSA